MGKSSGKKNKLNAKQRLFIKEYLKDKNAGRAYRAAGYNGKGARQSAHTLLTNPDVKREIEKGLKILEEKIELSAERVLKRISEIAFDDSHWTKHSDILKACELLGKHFKLFTDVHELGGKDGGPIVHMYLPKNGSEAGDDNSGS